MIVDCLVTPTTQAKGRQLVETVYWGALNAGLDARILRGGKPRKDAYIFLYGLGGADRIGYAGQPNVISFDAGYWDRKLDPVERKYRVSIGGFHCPQRIFKGPSPSPERWASAKLGFEEYGNSVFEDSYEAWLKPKYAGNPLGPILIVGNGPKSNRIGALNWCAEHSRKIRDSFPGEKIWYRPKPKRAHDQGVVYDALAEKINIDSVLQKCSLVVCRHSNVAVDAARLGIPCACEDGAAAAIYPMPQQLYDRHDDDLLQPEIETRREFLHRLAWWQWSVTEIKEGKFWPWMLEELAR